MASDKPKIGGKGYAILGGIIIVIVAAKVGFSVVMYNDWTCAFAKCAKVEIVNGKP